MNFYNVKKDNIIYVKKNADASFWDNMWNEDKNWVEKHTKSLGANSNFVKFFQNYIPAGGSILEAGCGRGQFVNALTKAGYDVLGIDYAETTVKILNDKMPELKVELGDVTDLKNILNASFDAYYSGGVIEHFWDGYHSIISEAHRILKSGGHMIVTFPFMSDARKRKKGSLAKWTEETSPEGFYQFALDPDVVIKDINSKGFKLTYREAENGTRGFIDNHPNFPILPSIYRSKSKSIFRKIILKVLNKFLITLGYAHTIKLVFVKD